MKINFKSTLAVLLLVATILQSCRKEELSITELNPQINSQAIKEMRLATTENSIKLIYATLTSSEKAAAWKQNINYYVNNWELSSKQIQHLNMLATKITPEVFDQADANFMAFATEWKSVAMALFSGYELRTMLTNIVQNPAQTLSVSKQLLSRKSTFVQEKPSCNCKSTNSFWTLCDDEDMEECTDLYRCVKDMSFAGSCLSKIAMADVN